MLEESNNVDEVYIIRPIIIVSLLAMHSFTIYGGGWPLPADIEGYRFYWWIQRLLYSGLLESFVFISGLVYAFQYYELNRRPSIGELAKKKFMRLLIPSIIFSFIYSLLFYDKPLNFISYTYDLINGLGHMWFLPMLFSCFMLTRFLQYIEIKDKYKLSVLLLVSISSIVGLPFQLKNTFYYLFYFYAAVVLFKNRVVINRKLANLKGILFVAVVFIMAFIPLTKLREDITVLFQAEQIFVKIASLCIYNLARIIYASLAVLLIYIIAACLLKKGFRVDKNLLNFNKCCFGIYLIHQFILKYMYYRTTLPSLLGMYMLPWVSFVGALLISIIITVLLRSNKIGRFLIG